MTAEAIYALAKKLFPLPRSITGEAVRCTHDILREVIPGRTLVPVPARDLVQGLGAIHCLTQQEPRLAAE